MRFVVRGVWQGKDVEIVWEDGSVHGPEEVVSLLHVHAGLRRDGLGPPLDSPAGGPNYDGKGLDNPRAALLLVEQLLDEVRSITNDQDLGRTELRARHAMRRRDD